MLRSEKRAIRELARCFKLDYAHVKGVYLIAKRRMIKAGIDDESDFPKRAIDLMRRNRPMVTRGIHDKGVPSHPITRTFS